MPRMDLFAPVFTFGAPDGVVNAVAALDAFKDAHLSVGLISALPEPIFVGDGLAGGMAIGEYFAQAQQDAKVAQEALKTALERAGVPSDQRLIQGQLLTVCDEAAVAARHADMTVLQRPDPSDSDLCRDVFEAILMESGRPVLALPPGWKPVSGFTKVMVAWNASREAARALGDAEPFLSRGPEIVVAAVNARPSVRGHGQSPGVDISAHLARRGFKVGLNQIDAAGGDRAGTLLRAVQESGAELLVMGGYGHSRLQQSIFGGVTRTMIDTCPVPVLMSH